MRFSLTSLVLRGPLIEAIERNRYATYDFVSGLREARKIPGLVLQPQV